VEPLLDLMARLQRNRGDLPGISYAQVAIAEECGRHTMQRVRADAVEAGRLPPWAGGIASLVPERNALGGRGLPPEQHAAVVAEIETVEVECIDFKTLADRYEIGEFDVLQIDTEGYDWLILRQIDLVRHRPNCIHVEIACLPDTEIDALLAFLRQAGYVVYAMDDGKDMLALRTDFGQINFGVL
jgi:FkbM family methyltransferase